MNADELDILDQIQIDIPRTDSLRNLLHGREDQNVSFLCIKYPFTLCIDKSVPPPRDIFVPKGYRTCSIHSGDSQPRDIICPRND